MTITRDDTGTPLGPINLPLLVTNGNTVPDPAFVGRFKASLIPLIGDFPYTFARSSTATVTDFEGLVKDTLAEEARFKGARRVHNPAAPTLFTQASSWSAVGSATVSLDTVNHIATGTSSISSANRFETRFGRIYGPVIFGHTFTISFECRANNSTDVGKRFTSQVNRYLGTVSGITNITLLATSEWTRYAIVAWSPGGDATTIGVNMSLWCNEATPFSLDVKEIQCELIDGQANQNPSEYVSEITGTDHGTNVDGVQYFDYENGNTVTSDVVDESVPGAAIPAATLEGVLIEGGRINAQQDSGDIANGAAWTVRAASMVVTGDSTDVLAPNGLNDATKIVGLGDPAVDDFFDIYGNGTFTNNARVEPSFYMRTISTSGALRVANAQAGGSLGRWDVDLSLVSTTEFERITRDHPAVTVGVEFVANATGDMGLQFLMLISGPADMYLWGCQCEEGIFPSSYIPTLGAAETRTAETLSYDGSAIDGTVGSLIATINIPGVTGLVENSVVVTVTDPAGGSNPMYVDGPTGTLRSYDGTNQIVGSAVSFNVPHNVGVAWGSGTFETYLDAAQDGTSAFDGDFSVANLYVGASVTPGAYLFGTIKELNIWSVKLDQTTMEGRT